MLSFVFLKLIPISPLTRDAQKTGKTEYMSRPVQYETEKLIS